MDAGKSNIFTSNLGKRELTNALGERLGSRICNKSIDIELHGADKRYLSLVSKEENN
jgi:DNA replication protein DnaC